jgi:hypothetical protein
MKLNGATEGMDSAQLRDTCQHAIQNQKEDNANRTAPLSQYEVLYCSNDPQSPTNCTEKKGEKIRKP